MNRKNTMKRSSELQKGQAMAEVVVALGILLLIFSAVIFFGEGYFYKSRTVIANRYAVWSESRSGDEVSKRSLASLFFGDEKRETHLEIQDAPDTEPFASALLGEAGAILGGASGTDGKTLRFSFRSSPVSDKRVVLASTHYLDGNTWMGKREPGNSLRYATWGLAGAKELLGAGGDFIGAVGGKKVKFPPY